MTDGVRLLQALSAFERDGSFGEDDYAALKRRSATSGASIAG